MDDRHGRRRRCRPGRREEIERLCRSVDGVVAVHQTIGYEYDNLGLDVEPPRGHRTTDGQLGI
ncbi:hypothetical protein OH805_35455 [Streptomyces sp. NBC_00879]|uniref:hypothetical protein n=1 Tax=Streptomyces sp. NBC_00879 TaxID=2975855 RepID=UPI00386CD7BD|nr:hypothetical protein OH805_35455 [Streptomyces sp. NBC_00879]